MSIILKKKIFIISVILFLSAFFLYTRHIIISHRNIPIVDVAYCARGDIENTISATGYITSENKVIVQPKVSGIIEEIYVEDGEKVKRGDKLIQLSTDEIEAQIKQAESQLKQAKANLSSLHNESMEEQAKANLQSAKTNLQKAEKDLESYDVLFKEKVISKEQHDNIVYQYNQAKIAYNSAKKQYELAKSNPTSNQRKIAEAQVEQAEIQLKYLRERLKETTIFSPMDGVVVFENIRNLKIEKGIAVSPGVSLLTIIDMDNLVAISRIEEQNIKDIKIGQEAKITSSAILDKILFGKVIKISPYTVSSGEFPFVEVVIKLISFDSRIKFGSPCDVEIIKEKKEDVIVLPKEAIKYSKGGNFVFSYFDGKVRIKPVICGMSDSKNVEILQGLKIGEPVIISNLELKEGMKVKVRDNVNSD